MREYIKDDFDLRQLIKNKKKRKNSKAKGNAFENKVAEILNLKFNTTEFCRTPGSGAFATTHKLPDHMKVYGDLITPLNFRFLIECKKGYNKEGLNALFNANSIIYDFIDQAERDSKKSSKKFLVVIKQDRQPIIAISELDTLVPSFFTFHVTLEYKTRQYRIVLLEELLNYPIDNSYYFDS